MIGLLIIFFAFLFPGNSDVALMAGLSVGTFVVLVVIVIAAATCVCFVKGKKKAKNGQCWQCVPPAFLITTHN